MKYFIKTFGCQQNHADSERIDAAFHSRGMKKAKGYNDADQVIFNTCMIRESAENRVYGLVNNLGEMKKKRPLKIIVTGCMVGLTFRDKTGKYLKRIRELLPEVDEFMPIEEIGFDNDPVRQNNKQAWIPISNGCNNFCTFCVVPFTRGREISRPYEDVINEARELQKRGYRMVTLLGQNVNSYGADLIKNPKSQITRYKKISNHNNQKLKPFGNSNLKFENCLDNWKLELEISRIKPIYVKHLGRYRIPTLFPILLEEIAEIGFENVDFISSNPWDFSDELINTIARNKKITRRDCTIASSLSCRECAQCCR